MVVREGHVRIAGLLLLLLSVVAAVRRFGEASLPDEQQQQQQQLIPEELLGSFGAYPNLLQLNDEHRETFHPVILVPHDITPKVFDYRNAKGLASSERVLRARRQSRWWRRWLLRLRLRPLQKLLVPKRLIQFQCVPQDDNDDDDDDDEGVEPWSIGRYDENRESMYSSAHFQDTSHQIDGYGGQRTVHLGIDLGAPVGTKVHAFTDGRVHSVGYNPEFGDYGHVIVTQHTLPSGTDIWALYGHLDKSILRGKHKGTLIQKGQVIGRLGDCHENGGWEVPHVHFQLAVKSPETHDMPGASSVEDRPQALLDYPDPRYVLGPLY